jgi:hypothetical protein
MHKGGLSCRINSMYRDVFVWDFGGNILEVACL